MARYAMVGGMVKPGAKTGGAVGKAAGAAPRANRARRVADMLPLAGGAAFRRFGFVQSSVVTRWPEIAGSYARVSSPESIRFPPGKKSAGVLTLVVEGAHAPMMQHVAPLIVERVNRFFGYPAVDRVQIRQGVVQLARAKAPRAAPEAPVPLPAELGDSLREVVDPELRACLESLARGIAASGGPAAPATATAIPLIGRIGERKK